MSANYGRDINGRIDLGNIDFGSSIDTNTLNIATQTASVKPLVGGMESDILIKERTYSKQLRAYAESIADRCKRAENELARYREAWAGVIQREKEATKYLNDARNDQTQQERTLRQSFEAERIHLKQQMRAEMEQERKRLLDEIAEVRRERDRVHAQVEAQYSSEITKIKAEFSKCISSESANIEEKYRKITMQKDEVISNITSNLHSLESELTLARRDLERAQKDSGAEIESLTQQLLSNELNASMEKAKLQEQLNSARNGAETDAMVMKQQVATIERAAEEEKKKILRQYLSELGPREAMITSLRNEAHELRGLLITESKKLHEFVDHILAEISENKIEDLFDPIFLMYLKELQMAEPVHKRIQSTRAIPPPPPIKPVTAE